MQDLEHQQYEPFWLYVFFCRSSGAASPSWFTGSQLQSQESTSESWLSNLVFITISVMLGLYRDDGKEDYSNGIL